jgi:hypothetical protein
LNMHNEFDSCSVHWKSMAGILLGLILGVALLHPLWPVVAQQPTGTIPTVTGTPLGPQVEVYSDQEMVELYDGPSMYDYAGVGILVAGETAGAIGRSEDGTWIEILYPGVPSGTAWIYAPYVSLTAESNLPIVANPPTPTPLTTPTLNPTTVAAVGVNLAPTQLPTFTPPQPLEVPTFGSTGGTHSYIPIGLIVIGLVLIGILGAIVSFVRGR